MSTRSIKNQANKQDNPDFLWILRDFDFKVPENDPNAYLESKIKKITMSDYFRKRECKFLPAWKDKNSAYKSALNNLKSLIFGSLLRKKTLEGLLMNGEQVVVFFSEISKQLNAMNVINYGDLSITFHNTAKEKLKSVKTEFKQKLDSVILPINWETFNKNVNKFEEEGMNELTSSIKKDETFQKEYIDEYLIFRKDKIYFFEISNSQKLEDLHRGILKSLKLPIVEKINKLLYENNQKELETDLEKIEEDYKKKGIVSPEMDKILNEQFLEFSEIINFTLKIIEEKNGEIWIQESLKSFIQNFWKLLKEFPLPEDMEIEQLKNFEIENLAKKVKNDDVFVKLKEKLVKVLDTKLEEIKKCNPIQTQISNTVGFDIFLSYSRDGMAEETKSLRERLEKQNFKVWYDDICLPNQIGKDYVGEIIEGIQRSKIFLFVWNKKYSEKNDNNCMKEFDYAFYTKKQVICIELEKLDKEIIKFHLQNKYTLKLYHVKKDCKLSEIPDEKFVELVQSINSFKNLN